MAGLCACVGLCTCLVVSATAACIGCAMSSRSMDEVKYLPEKSSNGKI